MTHTHTRAQLCKCILVLLVRACVMFIARRINHPTVLPVQSFVRRGAELLASQGCVPQGCVCSLCLPFVSIHCLL